jgi:RNA polymerase sigma-70 factor (ECF subfamily)
MDVALMTDTQEQDEAESALLRRYRAGDMGAFGRLYDRLCGGLLLYAQSLTRDRAWAEDVVQESFVRLLDYDAARLRDTIRAFLFATARNLVRDERRKAAVRSASLPELKPRPGTVPAIGAEELSRAIDGLPEEQREALVLSAYAGMTLARIAEVTGEPEGTIRSRYRYAVEKLAATLRLE